MRYDTIPTASTKKKIVYVNKYVHVPLFKV